jgi:hypothetical protein
MLESYTLKLGDFVCKLVDYIKQCDLMAVCYNTQPLAIRWTLI